MAAAIDAFNGCLGDGDAVDAVQGLLDLVRAKINQNTARYAEVEAQLAVARQRYAEALLEEASDPSWLRTAPLKHPSFYHD